GQINGALFKGFQDQFRSLWSLVRRIHAGEIAELTAPCFPIKSFRVALLADFERCVDKNLNEFIRPDQITGHLPLATERGIKCRDCYKASFDKELGALGHTANIRDPIGLGEAEIAIKTMADIIAIEHECPLAEAVEFLL